MKISGSLIDVKCAAKAMMALKFKSLIKANLGNEIIEIESILDLDTSGSHDQIVKRFVVSG